MPKHTQADNAAAPRSPEEVEHIVVLERLHRYNYGLPCGAAVLRRHLRDDATLHPLPSVRRISQILTVYGLTHGRTGWYEGEELDWLPASARVPKAQRRHLSLIDSYGR
jgi:hypothetical protein